MAEFVVVANLPWLDYGQGFGANAWQPKGGLARPERRARMRRVLGELPTRGASLTPSALLKIAKRAGYSGALAWSALATDRASDHRACAEAVSAWAARTSAAVQRA